jgi:hypothetical protein
MVNNYWQKGIKNLVFHKNHNFDSDRNSHDHTFHTKMARTTGRKRLFNRLLVDEVEAARSGYTRNEADYLNNPKEWSMSEFTIPFEQLVEELKYYDHYSPTERMELLNHWANFPELYPFGLFDIRNWFVELESIQVIEDSYYGLPIGGCKMVRVGSYPGKFPYHRVRNEEISQHIFGESWEVEGEPPKRSKAVHAEFKYIDLTASDSDSDGSVVCYN